MEENILFEQLVSIRRKLHENPELGFRETRTSEFIANHLNELSIPFRKNIAVTGIVAELSKGPGRCIALRADMDALPIQEETGLEYSSKSKNVMHACGHDLHMTILIGAIHLLKDIDFKGKIKFIFQPSEEGTYTEVFKDGSYKSGGQRIVEAGELDDVDSALGLHVHPLLETGKIAYRTGEALAAAGFFKISIIGKAGHAAFPEKTIDPILISSQIITSAQFIISRYSNPSQPSVISFTKIEGGVSENIIPGEVSIWGTVRALDNQTYEDIKHRLKEILNGIEIISKAKINIEYTLNYPSLDNKPDIHQKLIPAIENLFSKNNIIEVPPMMGGEDFAFISRRTPSMFYFLGAKDGENEYFLHHPKVIFDEKCIPLGSHLLANGALALLNQ